ncbi:hypothetical protein NESM_000172800 [Novymonas esmeraldas]|uniref:Uncharacterized protein n=1 Tax=Novymonas esmeraldas TaxID=1808958 RepID=A0AAW0F5M9_9TRYP
MAASMAPAAVPRTALLRPKEAAEFYEAACRSEGVFIHSTFLKQLLLGSVLIQFENGYLGGSGIGPILRTLQRAPLRALLLSKCALSAEDIKLVCTGLAQHPELEKIDVRGVPLTIGGAKDLLHLVTRNPHITEVLMDESLPKYVAIQQQCNRNAQATYRMSECVICGAGVPSTAGTSCETQVLRFALEHLKPAANSVSVAGVRVLCGALQQCMDRNSGVLAVCAGLCAESLAEDLCRCVSSVTKALVWQRPYDAPNLVFLRAYLTREHSRLLAEAEQEKRQQQQQQQEERDDVPECGGAAVPSLLVPGPVDAAAEERWRTKRARTDIDAFLEDDNDLHLPRCTVCGQPGECSQEGPTWLLRVLQKDITEHGAAVTPVALTRLCRLLGTYASLRPCSRRCVRHVVRYGLYGYGGVHCSYASGCEPLSSVVGGHAELQRLPLVSFSVVDVEREAVVDIGGGELNCALTVASAIGDEEGVAMDPYLLFAIGRQLRQQSLRTLGMDLASACMAVRLVGCLPVSEAPFKYRSGGDGADAPPRDLVADWATWSSAGGTAGEAEVRRWLHHAFAHRRQRVCVIDGPHRDLFDNIRAALWTLRQQARSVLVTMKFAVAWLSLPNGVIPPDASAHTHGIYTTAKVVGQSTLENTVYIILQCPLGSHTGYKGFFFFPKSVFLQTVRGLAFVFIDSVGPEYRAAGRASNVYGYELVGRAVGVSALEALRLLRRLFTCLVVLGLEDGQATNGLWASVTSSCDVVRMRRLFRRDRLPAPLLLLRQAVETRREAVAETGQSSEPTAARQRLRRRGASSSSSRTYWERVLLSSRFPSQLLFFFNEVIGTRDGAAWLRDALQVASTMQAPVDPCAMSGPLTLSLSATRRGVDLVPPPPTGVAPRRWIETTPAPTPPPPPPPPPPTTSRKTASSPATPLLPAEAKPKPPPSRSPSPPTQRKSVRRDRATSRSPSAPSASTAPPTEVKKKAGSAASAAASSRKQAAAPKRSPRSKSSASQESVARKSTASATSASATPSADAVESRPSSPVDRTHVLLQREWGEERSQRQACLKAAASVGLVEFLRSRSIGIAGDASTAPPVLRGATASGRGAVGVATRGFVGVEDTATAISTGTLGKPWFIVPFRNDGDKDGDDDDVLLLFIGDTVTAYSQREAQVLCGPVAMRDDPVLAEFPFCTGVDAAVPHPSEPHLVFFFSGLEWLLFDLHLAECVDGPYAIGSHGQFRRLPSVFHDRRDGVVGVPHTTLFVFFRDFVYVVFDVAARRCVGGMGYLNPPVREPVGPGDVVGGAGHASSSMPPALEDLIRTLYPASASTTTSTNTNTAAVGGGGLPRRRLGRTSTLDSDADDIAAAEDDGTAGVGAQPLLLSTELQRLLGTAPMTALCVRAAAKETQYLVSRTGVFIPVRWQVLEDAGGADGGPANAGEGIGASQPRRWLLAQDEHHHQPHSMTPEAPLRHLPLVFRQFTTAALASLCALAVRTECALKPSAHVSPSTSAPQLCLFDPERQPHESSSASAFHGAPSRGTVVEREDTSVDVSVGAPRSPCSEVVPPSAVGGGARITSSLVATALSERAPLALSRCGSAQDITASALSGTSMWRDEVFFYGDADDSQRPQRLEEPASPAAVAAAAVTPHCDGACAATRVDRAAQVSYIEYDLGFASPQRIFTGLLMILDTSALPSSVLQLATLMSSVDSSTDGQVYFPQAMVRLTGSIVTARWGSGPGSVTSAAARFWRVRFCTPVPASLGIVRLFWMEAVPGTATETQLQAPMVFSPWLPLLLTVPTSAAAPAGTSGTRDPLMIEAAEVLQPARQLISRDNLYPVFVDDASNSSGAGWFNPHTALPELDCADVCTTLFVCGSSIVQTGWSRHGTALAATQAEAQPIADRAGFRGLPYPFVLGWDAAFYPAPQEHPGRVAILRGEWLLLWDMQEQRLVSDVLQWRASALLEGLASMPIDKVVAVVNCWSSEESSAVVGVVHTASSMSDGELMYVELDLTRGAVLNVPVPLATYVATRFRTPPPGPGAVLHTILCSPSAPSTWYLFWDRGVQVASTAAQSSNEHDVVASDAVGVLPLAQSRLFYSVPLYLSEWGRLQHHCRVLLDVPRLLTEVHGESGGGLVIAGVQLVSAGGRGGETTSWKVQCSENGGSSWKDVAVHHQAAGGRVCGETLWAPSDAYALSKCPYWRLSRISSTHDAGSAFAAPATCSTMAEVPVRQSYSQLRLLTVPRRGCRQLPSRVSGAVAGTTLHDIRAFFVRSARGPASVSVQACGPAPAAATSSASGGAAYELLWDYGSTPVPLCSVTFKLHGSPAVVAECKWSMLCSRTLGGEGQCVATATKVIAAKDGGVMWTLSWLPNGLYRYWRLYGEWRAVAGAQHPQQQQQQRVSLAPSSLALVAFTAHEYDGPLLSIYSGTAKGVGATSLLWPLAEDVTRSPFQLRCVVNSVVQLSRVTLGLTLWDMEFVCESGSCTARLAVEYTDDTGDWTTAAETVINVSAGSTSTPARCTLSWPSCGAHVLWQLRVVETSTTATLSLTRVRLGDCPATTHLSLYAPPAPPSSSPSAASPRVGADAASGSGRKSLASTATVVAPADSAGGAAVADPVSISLLTLKTPRRLVRVRAVLASAATRYSVEYLGLDGASWLAAAVLDGASVSGGAGAGTASVSWDGSLVSVSTHWRLRLVDGVALEPPTNVEWFERSSEYAEMIDTAEVPGMIVSTTGFTEVQPPRLLSGSTGVLWDPLSGKTRAPPRMPVLQCTAQMQSSPATAEEPAAMSVTWSFISPLTFDQLLLSVQSRIETAAAAPVAAAAAAAETADEGSPGTTTALTGVPPPPAVSAQEPLQCVVVETSNNGHDYVAVADGVVRLCDRTVSLRWVEVAPSSFWRLRFTPPPVSPPPPTTPSTTAGDAPAASALPAPPPPSPPPETFTLQIYAAGWLVKRGAPALLSQIAQPAPGRSSNTVYRAWMTEIFNRENAFMQACLRGSEEYASTQSKLRASGDISRVGEVAGAVLRLKQKYQTFLQKVMKEAARRVRAEEAEPARRESAQSGAHSRAAPPLLPPSVPARVSGWLSEAHLSSDLIHLLVESATTAAIGGPYLLRLVELVQHRLAFRQPLQFTKRSSRWFYPVLEAVGPLAEDWHRFPAANVCAAYAVYWSLSTALQRQLDALLGEADTITPLSEHVASPLITVRVAESHWVPSHHFPAVAPFLYAAGFAAQPVTVVYAINDVVFPPPYALGIPGARDSQPLLSPYAYTIRTGVNFVQQCSLSRCPTPAMDVLRYILPASAFALDAKGNAMSPTTMVLTVNALHAAADDVKAVVRFTVSGEGVDFGLPGLVMDAIEFEVLLTGDGATNTGRGILASHPSWRMNYVSHGARFVGSAAAAVARSAPRAGDSSSSMSGTSASSCLPVSLTGGVEAHGLPLVSVRGTFGNARFSEVAELPGAVVTHLYFKTLAHVDSIAPTAAAEASAVESGRGGGSGDYDGAPRRWVCSPLEGEGQVFLPGVSRSCACACTIDTTCWEGSSPARLSSFMLGVDRCSVNDLKALSRACRGGGDRDVVQHQVSPVTRRLAACSIGGTRLEVAATVRVLAGRVGPERVRVSLKGRAVLCVENTVIPDASLEMDCGAGVISLSAQCEYPLWIGAVLVEGGAAKPVLLQMTRPATVSRGGQDSPRHDSDTATSLRFLVSGHARLFGADHAARVTLELAESTEGLTSVTLVAASLRYPGLVLTLQDCVVSEVWRYAQVTINERALRIAIERDIVGVPILAALQAHQIPLALSVTSVAPEPYDMATQRLSCRVNGLLYGATFSVATSAVAPDDVDDLWSVLGAQCVPAIVEQCEANLWASYANVVGLREMKEGPPSDADATT